MLNNDNFTITIVTNFELYNFIQLSTIIVNKKNSNKQTTNKNPR